MQVRLQFLKSSLDAPAGITSVFFNDAQWDLPWLRKIFPGTARYPHRPDVVVNDFAEFWALVLTCRARRRPRSIN
jgi:phosphoglycolate phosphatase